MTHEGATGRLAPQLAASLEVWIVAGGRFEGEAPSPALASAVAAIARRVVESGRPQSQDVELTESAAGSVRAVRLVARKAGSSVVVASLGLDGLREVEDALSRNEMMMHATRDAVWDWNVTAQRAWWNRQQYGMLGYDPASTEPSYEAWASRIHPDDRERVLRHFDAIIAGDATVWQDEFRFVRGDGSEGVALDRGCVERAPDGKPLRMIGVMTDITAERAASAALKTSEERFRQLTTAIDQVFWLTNPDKTEVVYVSPAYETVWGRSPESLYRRPDSFLEAIHDDDRPGIEARLPAQRESNCDEVYRIRRPDGSIAWIRDRSFPIRDASGAVVRIAGVATDITVHRKLEQQLAQAQRLESVGRLAGGIAHDFNNLLTVILASVQMAAATAARLPAGAGLHADLDAIKDAGERAARLTSQLVAFARRQVVAPARLDINELARQMDQLLRRLIGEHIELRTALEPGLASVIADRAQLEQVVVNLAINARDAMPGGGRLTIETRNAVVGAAEASARGDLAAGDYIVLAVSDTGAGIRPEDLPHVFEPFFSTKPAGQGTGLGLATCYGIVRQAGGTIVVDTEAGRGTTFTILLPRAGQTAEPSERATEAELRAGTETVLFVEDDPAVRRIGVHILRERQYRVLEAGGGEEALQLAAAHEGPIQLLITDVIMPHMSGTELARRLLARRPDLRVLYTSGYTEDAVVRDAALSPNVAFLQKPYVIETLLGKMRELLDARG